MHRGKEAVNKLAEGDLRKSHLELEVSILQNADLSANEVLKKCRDTCREADILLKEVLKAKIQASKLKIDKNLKICRFGCSISNLNSQNCYYQTRRYLVRHIHPHCNHQALRK